MRIENIFNPFFIRNTKCVFTLEKLKGKAQNTKQESRLIRVRVSTGDNNNSSLKLRRLKSQPLRRTESNRKLLTEEESAGKHTTGFLLS